MFHPFPSLYSSFLLPLNSARRSGKALAVDLPQCTAKNDSQLQKTLLFCRASVRPSVRPSVCRITTLGVAGERWTVTCRKRALRAASTVQRDDVPDVLASHVTRKRSVERPRRRVVAPIYASLSAYFDAGTSQDLESNVAYRATMREIANGIPGNSVTIGRAA